MVDEVVVEDLALEVAVEVVAVEEEVIEVVVVVMVVVVDVVDIMIWMEVIKSGKKMDQLGFLLIFIRQKKRDILRIIFNFHFLRK